MQENKEDTLAALLTAGALVSPTQVVQEDVPEKSLVNAPGWGKRGKIRVKARNKTKAQRAARRRQRGR